MFSCVQLFGTTRTVAHQAPLSMKFSRQEYWSGQLFFSPGDLPDSGIEPRPPTLQADSLLSEPTWKPHFFYVYYMPRRELSALHTIFSFNSFFLFSFNSIILRAYYMLGPMVNSEGKGGGMNRGTNLMKLNSQECKQTAVK